MSDVYHRKFFSSRSIFQEEIILLGMTLGIHSNVQTTDKETLPRELVDGDIQGRDAGQFSEGLRNGSCPLVVKRRGGTTIDMWF